MENRSPEQLARQVIEQCGDCEHCRELMDDTPCLVFTDLFKLWDKEVATGEAITAQELRNFVEICNFCGLCPCPQIRTDIRKAKDAFIERDGLKPSLKILEDVQRVATICGAFPALSNAVLRNKLSARIVKAVTGIHPDRQLPTFPAQSFPEWAKRRKLDQRPRAASKKVAYFVGCTGNYFFPEVPQAAVEVLERNEIGVFYPEQKCCGMPSMLEGDREFTFELAGFNLERLFDLVEDGYDIVCSCPTCGYLLKSVFSDGAYDSAQYQSEHAGGDGHSPSDKVFMNTRRVLSRFFGDEGYFAALDPRKRVRVARRTFDLGEYLRALHRSGEMNVDLGAVPDRLAYYPPCHQREQNVGEPWAELLALVPNVQIGKVGDAFDCCGIAGIMGFKREFHEISVAMGERLMQKIRRANPDRLISDCLSCRIQFNQCLPHRVAHPVEILAESYRAYGG